MSRFFPTIWRRPCISEVRREISFSFAETVSSLGIENLLCSRSLSSREQCADGTSSPLQLGKNSVVDIPRLPPPPSNGNEECAQRAKRWLLLQVINENTAPV